VLYNGKEADMAWCKMTTNSVNEFKAEVLRLLKEIENKAEQVRDDNSFVYANYDPTEENKIWAQGKNILLPLMQENPLLAFESLFDYLLKKGHLHFYPIQLVKHFASYSQPISQELISMLKQHLFESEFPFIKQAAMEMLGAILFHQPDKDLQNEIMGFLLDEDPAMRLISVIIFENLKDERAIPFLRLLLDDVDMRVRQKSHLSLAFFNTSASHMALREWRKQNPIV
jgi:hypothetical protein